ADAVRHRIGGLEKPMEAKLFQFTAKILDGKVGKQHDGVLVDVLAEVARVEVVVVQVRDVQVVAVAERIPVQRAVVRKRKPGGEVRRVHPRVAQDAAGPRVDAEAGVSDAGDLHKSPFCELEARCVSLVGAGISLAKVEPVYATVIQTARLLWRLQGLKFTVSGVEHLPRTGGAVIAINHTSYFDFTFAGLPAYKQGLGRKVRFMAKQEVFDHKIAGPLMRSLRHIPVDRASGAESFDKACEALKAGELVGVYPEATISRSFEIKELKSGTARMAIAADVPIVPHIVWGAQRIWTKDHPKKMWRPKVPITVAVGEPILPTLPAPDLTALLHSRMQ